jgi:hypothetical protein
MHPDMARPLIAQHHHDLRALARGADAVVGRPRAARRRLALPAIPHWRITWSRGAAPASGAGGRTWLIVISARSAYPARSAAHPIA